MDKPNIIVSCILIVFLVIFERIQEKHSIAGAVERAPLIGRWLVYSAVILMILLFGVYGDANSTQFIYFQF
jgi:hypothetical protein